MNQVAPEKVVSFHIRKLQELPSLSANERLLLECINDDDAGLRELVKIIETCPAVAARILGLARSAFFSQSIPCRTVFDAVVRVLGLTLVRNLAIGIVTSGRFSPERCPGFTPHRYWRSVLTTAMVCRLVAARSAVDDTPQLDEAYIHGLLHNLGLLALTHVAPQHMSRVFTIARNSPDRTLADIELEQLEVTHMEAGCWLVDRWHLPPELIVIMQQQDNPEYRGPDWVANALVRLSRELAAQLSDGVDPNREELADGSALGLTVEDIQEILHKGEDLQAEINGLAAVFAD